MVTYILRCSRSLCPSPRRRKLRAAFVSLNGGNERETHADCRELFDGNGADDDIDFQVIYGCWLLRESCYCVCETQHHIGLPHQIAHIFYQNKSNKRNNLALALANRRTNARIDTQNSLSFVGIMSMGFAECAHLAVIDIEMYVAAAGLTRSCSVIEFCEKNFRYLLGCRIEVIWVFQFLSVLVFERSESAYSSVCVHLFKYRTEFVSGADERIASVADGTLVCPMPLASHAEVSSTWTNGIVVVVAVAKKKWK